MICISFDQIIQHLIPKSSKREANFFVFCIFLDKKCNQSHDFSFPGTFKILSTTFKRRSPDHKSHDNHMIILLLSFASQQPLHQMLQFFLASELFLICFLLVLLKHHKSHSGQLIQIFGQVYTTKVVNRYCKFVRIISIQIIRHQ